MPSSVISSQGEQQAGMQQEKNNGLQKETMNMALQKLLEYRNTLESLVTVMKAVDPESVALVMPAVKVGEALEARLQQIVQRNQSPQPSMAGMNGSQGPQQAQAGALGM
jgi:hypothetical protein